DRPPARLRDASRPRRTPNPQGRGESWNAALMPPSPLWGGVRSGVSPTKRPQRSTPETALRLRATICRWYEALRADAEAGYLVLRPSPIFLASAERAAA